MWSLELTLEIFCSTHRISITWHFCSGPKWEKVLWILSPDSSKKPWWFWHAVLCLEEWLFHPASPGKSSWDNQAENMMHWARGHKISRELCCPLIPAQLTETSMPTKHSCGVSSNLLAPCCMGAASSSLLTPLLTPDAGAATGRFGLGSTGTLCGHATCGAVVADGGVLSVSP